MAAKPFSKEQLNFLKFTTLVFEEFPKVLRRIFVIMWDTTVASRPGFTIWYDNATVRNKFLSSEGGKTAIPTAKSIEEWDCTALFAATIYAKTFGHCGLTLNDQYLKKVKPAPCCFHTTVQGSTGNALETYALAIDQLRLLRNTLCHSSKLEITESDFDDYVLHLKNTLQTLHFDSSCVDDTIGMREDDFTKERVHELEEFQKGLQAICETIGQHLSFHANKLSSIERKQEAGLEYLSDIHKMFISLKEDKGNTPEERISIVAKGAYHPEPTEKAKLLAFKQGDVGQVIKKTDNGWWLIELQGKTGWVPDEYWDELVREKKNSVGESLHDYMWFWGEMSREKSEEILQRGGQKLSYIIRESDNVRSYVISVKIGHNQYAHFPILKYPSGMLKCGDKEFGSLLGVTRYYTTHPLFYTNIGQPASLGKPLLRNELHGYNAVEDILPAHFE